MGAGEPRAKTGLGWNLEKPEGKGFWIRAIPPLGVEEKRLVARVAELYQKENSSRKKGSSAEENLEKLAESSFYGFGQGKKQTRNKAGAKDSSTFFGPEKGQRKACQACVGEIRAFFRRFCIENFVMLEKEQVRYLCLALESHVNGFGGLDFLLKEEEIEEIASIGLGKGKPVHVFHREKGWLKTNLWFGREEYVRELVNRMARASGRRLSMNSPVLNAVLEDGNRISAAINPVSFSGPSFTIRKFKKAGFSPVQLVQNKTFSAELMAFLWIAMECDCSLLIAGNTGSGKTSSLNALLAFVPERERIVVVEETPEIRLEHEHFVKLNVVRERNVEMQDLIVESLRMRPDRIIVGEVRSREEVSAFIDTMLAGHGKGSYATFHGQSFKEALNRLRSLGVVEQDLGAIDLVVVQRRWNKSEKAGNSEVRRVVEVAELVEAGTGAEANPVFRFDYGKGRIVKCGKSLRVFEKARRSFSFGRNGWEKELASRQCFLEEKRLKGANVAGFFREVNSFSGQG